VGWVQAWEEKLNKCNIISDFDSPSRDLDDLLFESCLDLIIRNCLDLIIRNLLGLVHASVVVVLQNL